MSLRYSVDGEPVVKYEGAVLQTYEHNGYHDSYFYAIVYDAETDTVKEVEYGSTAYGGGMGVTVDATDEARAAAQRILFEERITATVEHYYKVARTPDHGKLVRVTATKSGKDRKLAGQVVPAGTTGKVFFVGDDRYRRGAKRYGIQTEAGERIYAGPDVFEVVDPEQYELTEADLRAKYAPDGIKSFYRPRAGVINMVA
jgi:hypothetical protein